MIAIGGSAGSLGVLREIVAGLPVSLPAAVLVVVHTAVESPGALPRMLAAPAGLPIGYAEHHQRLLPGRIYIAPPDHHLLLASDSTAAGGFVLLLSRAARENRHRPAIDPLFRSVARVCDAQAIGVVLSGLLEDGAAGLFAIACSGGRTLVQDPASAAAPDMPQNALRETKANFVLPPEALGPKLLELAVAGIDNGNGVAMPEKSVPSEFSCPECHGVLMETDVPPRFRCRTGHAYGYASLSSEYSIEVDRALWVALRTLREKAALARRLATRASPESHEKFLARATEADRYGDAIRDMIEHLTKLTVEAGDFAPLR